MRHSGTPTLPPHHHPIHSEFSGYSIHKGYWTESRMEYQSFQLLAAVTNHATISLYGPKFETVVSPTNDDCNNFRQDTVQAAWNASRKMLVIRLSARVLSALLRQSPTPPYCRMKFILICEASKDIVWSQRGLIDSNGWMSVSTLDTWWTCVTHASCSRYQVHAHRTRPTAYLALLFLPIEIEY